MIHHTYTRSHSNLINKYCANMLIIYVICILIMIGTATSTNIDTLSRGIYSTPTNLARNIPKPRRDVIIYLIPAFGQALDGLPCSLPCSVVDTNFLIAQLHKIDTAMMDNFTTDLIVFHEDYPDYEDILIIRNATKREIDFVNIDQVFIRIPSTLDPFENQPTWSKRAKWRYQQMIRFMVTDIFQFPVMDNVDYFMRLDIDSCFKNTFPNLFPFLRGPGRPAAYMMNRESKEAEHLLPGTELLEVVVREYVALHNIQPASPDRWSRAFPPGSVRTYDNNFEIVNVEFFRQKKIRDFIDYIEQSLGIFLYRWGDAGIRFVTVALFAADDEVISREYFGIEYHHPC